MQNDFLLCLSCVHLTVSTPEENFDSAVFVQFRSIFFIIKDKPAIIIRCWVIILYLILLSAFVLTQKNSSQIKIETNKESMK